MRHTRKVNIAAFARMSSEQGRRRGPMGAVVVAVVAVAVLAGSSAAKQPAAASRAESARPAGVLTQGFLAQATVDQFTRDLARVGIRVYDPGTLTPVIKVRKPVSPFALNTNDAKAAALGALARTGMSGKHLDNLMGKVALTRRAKVPVGAVIAGWAKRSRTPSARLARRLIGKVNWRHYRTIVFPHAATMLFASDIAVQFHPPRKQVPPAILSSASASARTPCSDALNFVDKNINAFFDWIGHLHTPRSFIEKVFGKNSFGSRFLIGISDYVTGKVNKLIDAARDLVLAGVRIPIKLITGAVAGIAATVSAVSKVANMLLPWAATLMPAPNPTAKGVGAEGIPGLFLLGVTAPGSSLQWPPELVNCAESLANFTLPTTTPTGAVVKWDVSGQYPGGLIRPGTDSGPLTGGGEGASYSQLKFVTTTETPEEAKGDEALGLVVAVAKVHRTDIAQLVDLVENTVFSALPDIIRKTFEPQLRKLAQPLVDKIKAKAGTAMDVEASAGLVVRYHTPKEEKKKKASATGTWDGTFQSAVYPEVSGTMVVQLVQTANRLSGTLTIAGSKCVSRGTLAGTIRNGAIHIGAVQAERAITFDGQMSGRRMSGSWVAPACADDAGTWAARKR